MRWLPFSCLKKFLLSTTNKKDSKFWKQIMVVSPVVYQSWHFEEVELQECWYFRMFFQDKLLELKRQLSQLNEGTHPEWMKKLKRLESSYKERMRINAIIRDLVSANLRWVYISPILLLMFNRIRRLVLILLIFDNGLLSWLNSSNRICQSLV